MSKAILTTLNQYFTMVGIARICTPLMLNPHLCDNACLNRVILSRLVFYLDALSKPRQASPMAFTRKTWRPGRNRKSYPRVRDWGGRDEVPAAFALNHKPGVFAPGAPRCRHCARPAMRELPVCRHHGGARWASARRPYAGRWQPKQGSEVLW